MSKDASGQSSDLSARLRKLAADDQAAAEFYGEAGYQRGLESSRDLLQKVAIGPPPDVTSDYQISGVLQSRGNTTLYVAVDRKALDEVVLKVLEFELQTSSEVRQRVGREIQALARLEHPKIVRFIDGRMTSGHAYLVMERIDGCDLAELVNQCGPLPFAVARHIGCQIAEALAAVDGAGMVHRDVKPSNVMLTLDGDVKLIDFGIAKEIESSDQTLTREDQILGTIDFMAPEQVLDTAVADIRSDLYGLGCTLFFLLTGKKPFESARGGNAIRTAIAHVSNPLPSIAEFRPDVDTELASVVSQLCEKDPRNRLSSPVAAMEKLACDENAEPRERLRTMLADVTRSQPYGGLADHQRHLQEKRDPRLNSASILRHWKRWAVGLLMVFIAALSFYHWRSRNQVMVNSVGMTLVRVPAGEFTMGSLKSAEALRRQFPSHEYNFKQTQPPHSVTISKPLYVGQTEVTQGQWFAVMGNQHIWIGLGRDAVAVGKDYPASSISWEEANEFCRRLSELEGRRYRLPTEAEWEYFARAGTQTTHSYGEPFDPAHGWTLETCETTDFRARQVALTPPNPWGLYDVYGNVSEWCSDWHDETYYAESPSIDPRGPDSGTQRVLRGGNYMFHYFAANSVMRWPHNPSDQWTLYGFRVVMEMDR